MDNLNGTCPHICPYKESNGYCRHTACINPQYKFDKLYSSNHTINADTEILSTYCIGSNCDRANECARYIGNAPIGITTYVINYYIYGSVTVKSDGIVDEMWYCGEAGNWNMFIKKEN